jgi:hypothetical protein
MDNRDGRREQTHGARTHARTTEQRAEAETGPTAAAKLGIVHGLQVKSTGASPGSANKTQFQGLVSSRGARRCRWVETSLPDAAADLPPVCLTLRIRIPPGFMPKSVDTVGSVIGLVVPVIFVYREHPHTSEMLEEFVK